MILTLFIAIASADRLGHSQRQGRQQQLGRQGRQEEAVQGGVDFSSCQPDPDSGLCCVEKLETIQSVEKDPILECTHKNVEKCHYTYVTQFTPAQEEVCDPTAPSQTPAAK